MAKTKTKTTNKRTNGKSRARFPTPEEMDALDDILSSAQPSTPPPEMQAWRKMRQLCNRMRYEERTGDPHPAWAGEDEIDPMTRDEFDMEPPEGMKWSDFGSKWDLAPRPSEDGDWEPLLRHESMASTWRNKVEVQAESIDLSE